MVFVACYLEQSAACCISGTRTERKARGRMFSLRSIFIVTAIVALLVGIFTTGSAWLVSAFFAVALLLSLWGAMERRKPFWRGFTYFGVGYMLVTTIPALSPIGGVLPTTMILIPNMTDPFTDSS